MKNQFLRLLYGTKVWDVYVLLNWRQEHLEIEKIGGIANNTWLEKISWDFTNSECSRHKRYRDQDVTRNGRWDFTNLECSRATTSDVTILFGLKYEYITKRYVAECNSAHHLRCHYTFRTEYVYITKRSVIECTSAHHLRCPFAFRTGVRNHPQTYCYKL